MPFVLFLLAALTAFTGCSSQGETVSQQITIAGVTCLRPTWHVGEFDPTGVMTHAFTLFNETDFPIRIAKIRSDCDCVVAREKAKEIPARGEVEIEVRLNISPRPGPIARKIVVQLETNPTEVIPLTIVGYAAATPTLHAMPSVLDFGILRKDETRSRKVRVMRYDGGLIGELSVVAEKMQLHSSRIDLMNEGQIAEVAVEISGDANSVGDFTDYLIISTSDQQIPTVVVPIRGSILVPSNAIVSSVYLESMQPGMEKMVTLRRKHGSEAERIHVENIVFKGDHEINVQNISVGDNAAFKLSLDHSALEGELYWGTSTVAYTRISESDDPDSALDLQGEVPVFVFCGRPRF